jgi:hypothetical protein
MQAISIGFIYVEENVACVLATVLGHTLEKLVTCKDVLRLIRNPKFRR